MSAATIYWRRLSGERLEAWQSFLLADRGWLGWLGANVAAAALYIALGYAVSRFFAAYGLFPAPIWLPSSIAVVAAMVGGARLLPALFVGSLVVNDLIFDPPFHVAAIISLTNALGPWIGVALARRYRPLNGMFTRFGGVIAFVVCVVVVHPAITATGGAFAVALESHHTLSSLHAIWVSWWLSDSGGTLYLTPALMLWLGLERVSPPNRRAIERSDFLIWLSVLGAAVMLFMTPTLRDQSIRLAAPFLLVVPVSWIALRMSLRSAYSLVSLLAILACAATVAGFGPFQEQVVTNPLQLVGAMVVLLAMDVLTIVALVSERREADEANKLKSMFLAAMSHDMRTPLNAVIGFAQVIRDEVWGSLGNENYREYIDHIYASGNLLLEIINNILDLSKIEAGKREIRPVALSGEPLLNSCVSLVQQKATEKRIGLKVTVEDAGTVYADDLAFRQILLNLLSNAIKFTPEGGRVHVRLLAGADGDSVLEVADTGVGMDAAGIQRSLEPFGQVRNGDQLNLGTGLGLPIAARLAELHGGKLSIASTPGKGTIVRVSFPTEGRIKAGATGVAAAE